MKSKTCGECRFYHPIFKHEGACTATSELRKTCDFTRGCAVGGVYPKPPPTVFQQITASPEVLAEEFVEPYTRWGEDGHLETLWRSNFRELSGMLFDTREETIAATVEKLKEVYNETTSN